MEEQEQGRRNGIDSRSGFCSSNSVFYSKRKPISLPPKQSLDVTTFISSHAHHGNIAFIDAATGLHFTYQQFWRAVDAVAASLSLDSAIRKGDVVLLLSPNSVYFPVVCLAVMSLGAVITTTNPLNTTREIAKQIADSKPVIAFTTPSLVPKIAGASPTLPIVLMESKSGPVSPPGAKIATTLEEMMRKEARGVMPMVEQEDTATLLYSSGTTGPSKGVISSHRNLIAMVQMVLGRFDTEEVHTLYFFFSLSLFFFFANYGIPFI